MRVLFTATPATGHINSILPVALATQHAGHPVAICTSPTLGTDATAMGLEHLPAGADRLEDLFPPGMPRSGPERTAWVRLEIFGKAAPNRLMPELAEHMSAWRPDVIVRESAEFAGCVLAEQVGLPHAAIATGSQSARADHRLLFRPSLDALRASNGLAPDPDVAMPNRFLSLSLIAPSWDGDAEVAPTLHFVRYEAPPSEGGDVVTHAGDDRPLVLAVLGTMFNRSPGLFESILEAVSELPERVIAAVGRDADPARFASVPDNVTVLPWVAQVDVLRRASLFITHGGFNSAKEALSLGVPLVVIPLGADQFYTAERVEALGLGLTVNADDRSPATIRRRAGEVLESPAYRDRAAAFAAKIAALPPLSEAVTLLERLARERAPIHRPALD